MPAVAAVDGGGAGRAGIGGDPAAIEAGADAAAAAAGAIEEAGRSVSDHGDTVVANWTGSASNAAHERIRFLGDRTQVGGDVLAGLPAILNAYAGALRAAQARFAAGKAAAAVASTALGAANAQAAAVAATPTVGDDPALAGRRLAAADAVEAATEAGAAAGHEMDAALADEQVANDVAATAVTALSEQMGAMRTVIAAAPAAPSPGAVDYADHRAMAAMAAAPGGLPDPHPGNDPRGAALAQPRTDAQVAAEGEQESKALDTFQDGLGVAGLIPGVGIVPDAVNTGIYALRGDWGNAGLSGVAIVPVVGVAGFAGRAAIKARRAAKLAEAADAEAAKAAQAAKAAAAARAARAGEVGDDGLSGAARVANAERRAYLEDVVRHDAAAGTVTRFVSPASSKPPAWPAAVADRPTSGALWVFPPKGATAAQILQAQDYAEAARAAKEAGWFRTEGRLSGTNAEDAALMAKIERDAREAKSAAAREFAAQGKTFTGDISHGPDSTWTGRADAHSWLDLEPSVNRSLGSQAAKYPRGFVVDEIVGPLDGKFIDQFDQWEPVP